MSRRNLRHIRKDAKEQVYFWLTRLEHLAWSVDLDEPSAELEFEGLTARLIRSKESLYDRKRWAKAVSRGRGDSSDRDKRLAAACREVDVDGWLRSARELRQLVDLEYPASDPMVVQLACDLLEDLDAFELVARMADEWEWAFSAAFMLRRRLLRCKRFFEENTQAFAAAAPLAEVYCESMRDHLVQFGGYGLQNTADKWTKLVIKYGSSAAARRASSRRAWPRRG